MKFTEDWKLPVSYKIIEIFEYGLTITREHKTPILILQSNMYSGVLSYGVLRHQYILQGYNIKISCTITFFLNEFTYKKRKFSNVDFTMKMAPKRKNKRKNTMAGDRLTFLLVKTACQYL